MLPLIGYEIRKTLAPKLTVVILAALFLLNCFLIDYTASAPVSDTVDINREQVAQVYAAHAGQSPEEFAAELQSWLEDYQGLWWVDEDGTFHQPTQERIQAMLHYTPTIGQESALIRGVLSQVEPLTGYEEYLDSVQENADRLTQSLLFSNENSFSYRSLKKTAQVYLPLYSVEVVAADSSAVTVALEGHTTTVLLLFAMVMVVLELTLTERDEGLLLLVKPTVNGRGKTITAKLAAMALLLAVLTLAFYGSNLILCAHRFGLGDLSRSIQSLDGYMTSPWRISVGIYIALFFVTKYLGLVTVGLVFFLLCICLKNRIAACAAGALLLMAELALYTLIPYHSWLSIFRQMNLAAVLDTASYFSDYGNLNLFEWPVSIAAASGVFCLLAGAGSVWIIHRQWCREETVSQVRNRRIRQHQPNISTSLFGHECYKLLIPCAGCVMLALLLGVQIVSYSGLAAYEGDDERWYQHYSETLTGPYSEENAQFLREEQAYFDSIGAQQQEYLAQAERGEISQEYAYYLLGTLSLENGREAGFRRAKNQYDYLQSQQEAGKSVSYVPTTGYNYLLDDHKSDVLDAAKLSFVLAVCLSVYFTMEDTSGVIRLIRPSPRGENAVMGRKWVVCGLWITAAWAIAFLPRIIGSLGIYPMVHADCAAVSLPQFQNAPEGWSIFAYFLLVNFLRLSGAYLAAGVVFAVSRLTRHPATVLIISLVILELPAFLYLLGTTGEFALLPLMTGHWGIG